MQLEVARIIPGGMDIQNQFQFTPSRVMALMTNADVPQNIKNTAVAFMLIQNQQEQLESRHRVETLEKEKVQLQGQIDQLKVEFQQKRAEFDEKINQLAASNLKIKAEQQKALAFIKQQELEKAQERDFVAHCN